MTLANHPYDIASFPLPVERRRVKAGATPACTLFCMLIGCLIMASSVAAQSFLTNGLVAYYPFNGNANDPSGFGNDLTSSNRTGFFRLKQK